VGVEFTPFTKFDSTTNFNQSGNFAFSGQSTGVGIADLLLGKVSTFEQSAGKYKRTRGKQLSAFVDDKFRLLPSLVLNLGLRWDPFLSYHDSLGQVTGSGPVFSRSAFPTRRPARSMPAIPAFPRAVCKMT
jgi:hypothetical protein